ncbi:MAG: M64 family metallopeptidase, partial [Planctomycetota bacterium]|nr:M64 family metallopeptidase [Planctomycetota bacterium]
MRALLATALLAAGLQAQIVNTVISNGTTESRYDMVILGDGYQVTEQNKFDNDVTTFLTALFQKEPYQTFSAYYNVHTVFRASQDSGADR